VLRFDRDGRLVLVYGRSGQTLTGHALAVATPDGALDAPWHVEEVDAGAYYPSVVIDDENTIHIVHNRRGSTGEYRYVRGTFGAWVAAPLLDGLDFSGFVIDRAGVQFVSYTQTGSFDLGILQVYP